MSVPGQILVFIEMLEEGGFTDQLLFLTHLFAGFPCRSELHLHSAQRRPHHLTVTEILQTEFEQGRTFTVQACILYMTVTNMSSLMSSRVFSAEVERITLSRKPCISTNAQRYLVLDESVDPL